MLNWPSFLRNRTWNFSFQMAEEGAGELSQCGGLFCASKLETHPAFEPCLLTNVGDPSPRREGRSDSPSSQNAVTRGAPAGLPELTQLLLPHRRPKGRPHRGPWAPQSVKCLSSALAMTQGSGIESRMAALLRAGGGSASPFRCFSLK